MLSRNPTVEKYTLRYAVGTVTGAIIILLGGYLHCPAILNKLCSCFKENGFVGIAGILLLGFAFSFIASCPLYVMHLNRSLLNIKMPYGEASENNIKCCKNFVFIDIIYFTVILMISSSIFIIFDNEVLIQFILLSAFIFIALYCSYLAFRCPQKIFDYYGRLCNSKSKGSDDPSKKFITEITDSYQGLRENGNAFAIIVMQVFLYFSWSAIDSLLNAWGVHDIRDKIPVYLGFAAIWVLPGWFGMLTAHKMEAHFMNRETPPER